MRAAASPPAAAAAPTASTCPANGSPPDGSAGTMITGHGSPPAAAASAVAPGAALLAAAALPSASRVKLASAVDRLAALPFAEPKGATRRVLRARGCGVARSQAGPRPGYAPVMDSPQTPQQSAPDPKLWDA